MIPSLYIHIPFCKRRCIYCNFYSSIYDPDTASSFVDTIVSQISSLDRTVHSIYIGGGTPSAFDRKVLGKLLSALKSFSIKSGEFTMEANPESIDDDKLKLLIDSGVNRLSIGVQSLDERKLKKLGRVHSAACARDTVLRSHNRGFKNIGADFIFGVWGETLPAWREELRNAAELPVSHISCYELTYEKGTPLFLAMQNKSVVPLTDDETAMMYETAIGSLGLAGLKQYEVSNFARSGYESRHNMHYWENLPYIGLGPSAVSYIDGTRSKNVSDLKEYMKAFRAGKPMTESSEKLPPVKMAKETAAVKIRTKEGIDFDWFKARTGFDFLELQRRALPKLIENGFVKYKKDGDKVTGIALKRKGLLFCDTVSSELL